MKTEQMGSSGTKGGVPKCTVAMSVYNTARYLPMAVESVLGQTFADFEFIIVDDGSEDGTDQVLAAYAYDARVQVVRKEHTGLPDSLNVALREARGEWIARMDADDISEPERLEQQLARVYKDPNVVLIGTGCTIINEAGDSQRMYRYPEEHEALVAMWDRGGSPFPHTSALFRRSAVLEVGLYNPRFQRSQDLDLWFRLSQVGTVACLSAPLVRLRKHAQAMSRSVDIDSAGLGLAPRACHRLRCLGLTDPSQGSDTVWYAFLNAARETAVRTRLVDSLRARAFLREELQAAGGGRRRPALRLGRALLRRPWLATGIFLGQRYRAAIRILTSWDRETAP